MSSDQHTAWRPLTPTERSLLESLLDHEFDGVEQLRAQAQQATASSGCECGCLTLDLHVPADVAASTAASPAPVEGTVLDAAGAPIGGLLLWVEQGRLSGLEVYSFDEPLARLPPPERVDWGSAPDAAGEVRPSWWRRLRSRQRQAATSDS